MSQSSSSQVVEQLLLNDKSFVLLRLKEEEYESDGVCTSELIDAIHLNRTVRSVILHDSFMVTLDMQDRRHLLKSIGSLRQLESFVYTSDSKKVRIPVDALADILTFPKRLSVFELNAPNLVGNHGDFLILSAGLGNLRRLRTFKLMPAFFEPGIVNQDPIFDALTRIESLEEVCISLKCDMRSKLSPSLLKYLCRSETLKVLDLRWAHLTDSHVEAMTRELEDNISLTELAIGGHNLGVKSCIAIAGMIAVNEGIRSLSLGSKGLSSDGCLNALWNAIESNPFLEEITLENTDMHVPSYKSLKTIAGVLTHNETIVSLRLFNMGLDDLSCAMLAYALKFNATLRELDIRKGNERISDQGYEAMAKMLEQNYSLQKLHTNATSGHIKKHFDLCLSMNQSSHKYYPKGRKEKYDDDSSQKAPSMQFFNPLRRFTMCK